MTDINPGARCPLCGCAYCPVIPPTRYRGKWTVRTRQCRNCGKRYRTQERTVPAGPQPPDPE